MQMIKQDGQPFLATNTHVSFRVWISAVAGKILDAIRSWTIGWFKPKKLECFDMQTIGDHSIVVPTVCVKNSKQLTWLFGIRTATSCDGKEKTESTHGLKKKCAPI